MPVSLSAVERGNPPPRKKSCGACIKAKRRCTLETPSCQRCSQRKLDCKYPPGAVPKKSRPRDPPTPQIDAVSVLDEQLLEQLAASIGPDFATTDHPLYAPSLTHTDTSASSCSGNISLTDIMFENHTEQTSCPVTASSLNMDMSDDGPTLSDMAHEAAAMQGMSEDSMRWYISFPRRVPLESRARDDFVQFALKSRLQYSIDNIVAGPRRMVLENQTPWCHRNLYEHHMPRSMEDAQAACALHMAKNTINSHVIMRSLNSRVRELGTSPMPTDGLEILARTQALLLYHIMRLFDCDIRTREDAEATTQYLEESATALASHISFKDDEPCGDPDTPTATLTIPQQIHYLPLQQAAHTCTTNYDTPTPHLTPHPTQLSHLPSPQRTFWESWIFEESARRTWMLTFFMIQMYRLLKGNIPVECDGNLTKHPFTLSAHLWGAGDPLGFATAWRTKEHFMVKDANFSNTFEKANSDDIDVFGKILITTVIGIDETRHWLRSIGGDL